MSVGGLVAGGLEREHEVERTIPRNEFEARLAGGRRTHIVHVASHEEEVAAAHDRRMDRRAPDDEDPFVVLCRCAGDSNPAGTQSSAPQGPVWGSPQSAAMRGPAAFFGSTRCQSRSVDLRVVALACGASAFSASVIMVRSPEVAKVWAGGRAARRHLIPRLPAIFVGSTLRA